MYRGSVIRPEWAVAPLYNWVLFSRKVKFTFAFVMPLIGYRFHSAYLITAERRDRLSPLHCHNAYPLRGDVAHNFANCWLSSTTWSLFAASVVTNAVEARDCRKPLAGKQPGKAEHVEPTAERAVHCRIGFFAHRRIYFCPLRPAVSDKRVIWIMRRQRI